MIREMTAQFGDRNGFFRLFDTEQANFGLHGYRIIKWLDLSGNEYAPLSSVRYSDISAFGETSGVVHLSAVWEKDSYGLSAVNFPPECSSRIFGIDRVYVYQTFAEISAGDEDENYQFAIWRFPDGSMSSGNPIEFRVLSAVTISAYFKDLRTIQMETRTGELRSWRYNQLSGDLIDENVLTYRIPGAIAAPFVNGPFNAEPELSDPNMLVTLSIYEERLTAIGGGAFSDCQRLYAVVCPRISSIGESSFARCPALASASFPDLLRVGKDAFHTCSSMTSAYMPSVEYILSGAFAECARLSTVDFGRMLSAGALAFGCESLSSSLAEVRCPNLTAVGPSAFYGCGSLQAIDGISGVTDIKRYALAGCEKLKVLNLLSARDIGTGAMMGCGDITTIYMPNVSSIGASAFYGCDSLQTIDFGYTLGSVPGLHYAANRGAPEGVICYIPKNEELYSKWISSEDWQTLIYNYNWFIVQHTRFEPSALASVEEEYHG